MAIQPSAECYSTFFWLSSHLSVEFTAGYFRALQPSVCGIWLRLFFGYPAILLRWHTRPWPYYGSPGTISYGNRIPTLFFAAFPAHFVFYKLEPLAWKKTINKVHKAKHVCHKTLLILRYSKQFMGIHGPSWFYHYTVYPWIWLGSHLYQMGVLAATALAMMLLINRSTHVASQLRTWVDQAPGLWPGSYIKTDMKNRDCLRCLHGSWNAHMGHGMGKEEQGKEPLGNLLVQGWLATRQIWEINWGIGWIIKGGSRKINWEKSRSSKIFTSISRGYSWIWPW